MTDSLRASARILVAEDNAEMRLLVVEALEKDGHLVEEATDGREALARLTLREPTDGAVDLVISDVRMPGLTGFQVVESARAAGRVIPVILMTAFGDPEMRARARALDAVLLDKPFVLEDLRACVARVLRARDLAPRLR